MVQNRSSALVTRSAREGRGKKLDETQPDYQNPQRAFALPQPIEQLPSHRCIGPPAFGTRQDEVPSFLTLEQELSGKGPPRRLVGLSIVFVILFVCFFALRTHLTSLSVLLDFAPRLSRAGSRSSAAASRRGLPKVSPPLNQSTYVITSFRRIATAV